MTIADEVKNLYDSLTLPEKEARNIALASVLEPMSDKAGCITRFRDCNHKSVEMFLSAGVNIYPAYSHLASYVLNNSSVEGMYRYFHDAVLLGKASRKGSQINLGILEFSTPIVAAHALTDPDNARGPEYVFRSATDLLKETSVEDVKELTDGKAAAMEITFDARGKKYPVFRNDAKTIYDYYMLEFLRESNGGHPTGVTHNRQFISGFPDIKLAYDTFMKSKGRFSERLTDAYNTVMAKQENLGIGPGLAADFAVVTAYLALTYSNGLEIID